jgi:hypothetical protein
MQLSSDAFTYMVYTDVLVGSYTLNLKGALSAGKTVKLSSKMVLSGNFDL